MSSGWLIALAALCAGIVGVAVSLERRRQRGSLLLLAAATGLGVLLVSGLSVSRSSDTVVLVDQPIGNLDGADRLRLWQLLAGAGTRRCKVLCIDPDAPVKEPGEWVATDAPQFPQRAENGAGSVTGLAIGVDRATRMLAARTQARGWTRLVESIFGLGSGRIVVCTTDRETWRRSFQPVDVDRCAHEILREDIMLDRIDLEPQPITSYVEMRADVPLRSGEWRPGIVNYIDVTVRSPRLANRVHSFVEVLANARLGGVGVALSASWRRLLQVLDGGVLMFSLETSEFVAEQGARPLAEGFVPCVLDLEIATGAAKFAAKGTTYLPVRDAELLIVAGAGDPQAVDRLRAASCASPANADPVEAERLALRALLGRRSDADILGLGSVTVITEQEWRDRLDGAKPPPALAVLSELSTAFWSEISATRGVAYGELVRQAVTNGGHYIVVGPPASATGTASPATWSWLPAHSVADSRSTTWCTIADRTPILNVVFDHGRWGRLPETPGSTNRTKLPPALDVQIQCANTILDSYRAQNLLFGHFLRVGDDVVYDADSKDLVLVRVAPRLRAHHAMTDTLFASSLSWRLAAATRAAFDRDPPPSTPDPSGLGRPPAAPYVTGDPCYTPNQAFVVFTGDVPQPSMAPGLSASVHYSLGNPVAPGSLSAPVDREAMAPPPHALATILARGATIVAITIDVGDYKAGFAELPLAWLEPAPNPLVSFSQTYEQWRDNEISTATTCFAMHGAWIAASDAKKRIHDRSPSGSRYRIRWLGNAADREQDVKDAAVHACAVLLPLHAAPSRSMVMVPTAYARWFDERIGPSPSCEQLKALVASADPLAFARAIDPLTARAAPQRFRRLTLGASASPQTTATYLAAAECELSHRSLTEPLAIGSRLGEGSVLVMGYSPFELGPAGADTRNAVNQRTPNGSRDAFGIQRVEDLLRFSAHLSRWPHQTAQLEAVETEDARGGLELTLRMPALTDAHDWVPTLKVSGPTRDCVVALEISAVEWSRRVVRYRAPAASIERASAEIGLATDAAALDRVWGEAVIVVEASRVLPGSAFPLRRPEKRDWIDRAALASVDDVAFAVGGRSGEPAVVIAPLRRPGSPAWTTLLCGVLLSLGILRGRWRWRGWFARRHTDLEAAQVVTIDPIGLIEEHGGALPEPRGGVVGIYDHESPMRVSDKISHAPQNALAKFLLRIGGVPVVRRVIQPRSIRCTLLVDLGSSMRASRARRLGAGSGFPQIDFAIAVAEFLTTALVSTGAQVQLLCVGIEEHVRIGPFHVLPGRGAIKRRLEAVVEDSRACETVPAEFGVDPGAHVTWVGDLREQTTPTNELLVWAQAYVDEGGRFAVVRTRVRRESELVGMGLAWFPLRFVDRTTISVAELEAQMQSDDEELARVAERAGVAFCVLHDSMSSELVLETLIDHQILAG